MIGTRGIAGRRPDTSILFVNEICGAEGFSAAITPFFLHPLVQTLSESFGQTIGDGFGHNGVVVVILGFESVAEFFESDAAGYRESAEVIPKARFFWRDEINKRSTGFAAFPICLLAEKVKSAEHFSTFAIRIQFDIIAHGIGGEKAIHTARRDQIFFNDLIQQSIGFTEDLSSLRALPLIVEDAGVDAFQFPGVEERRPVNKLTQCRQRKIVQYTHAGKFRCGQVFGAPLNWSPPGTGDREGYAFLPRCGMSLAERFVVDAILSHEGSLIFVTQKAGGHRHGAARIEHVDDRLAVVRSDLHGGVSASCRGSTDEQRQLKTLTLHFTCHVHHFIKRGGNKTAESDHVGLLRLGAFKNLFAGDHYPQVDYVVIVASEDHSDDILANVVNISLDRSEQDLALRLNDFARRNHRRLLSLHEGSEVCDSLFHHSRGFHHLRQEHLAGSEQVTHHAHARH